MKNAPAATCSFHTPHSPARTPPLGLTPHSMQKSCHCEASAHTGCGNPRPPTPHLPGRAHGPCSTNHPVERHPCVPPHVARLAVCHCEPVTDVTGVAIRIPRPRVGQTSCPPARFCTARLVRAPGPRRSVIPYHKGQAKQNAKPTCPSRLRNVENFCRLLHQQLGDLHGVGGCALAHLVAAAPDV